VNAGEMINVKIKETSPWYLEGSINNGI